MTGEKIEILITAEIRDCGEESEELLREDLKDELEKCVKRLSGNHITRKGMWFYLENIEHEVAFQDEGNYEFVESRKPICVRCSKKDTPECKKSRYTIYKGVMVGCGDFESDAHDE
ncbi:MAG: hypothetical protein KAS66_00035 [Candidatus Omnitrophica bacterium]|nr:hypothetical protein [Candidatus Omnitrophota bacterium]